MGDSLKVTALTGAKQVPSARFRLEQYIPLLGSHGVELNWRPAPVSGYPPARRWLRPLWLPVALAARVPGVVASWDSDVTFIGREFISTLSTLESFTRRPRVFDVDDAIWLRRGGGFARHLARRMDIVVAGNNYLAEWFGRYCSDVEILPTAVDCDRFVPGEKPFSSGKEGSLVIGWSGTSSNFPFLYEIEQALARVMRERPDVQFHVSSDRPPGFRHLPAERVRFVPWSMDNEVGFIQSLDVGLMPLRDSEWSRGKCAYKMLLYLACGIPVVVSPVGMNAEVLQAAAVGLGAGNSEQWRSGVLELLGDDRGRREMGAGGRELVVSRFSLSVLGEHLARILKRAAGSGNGPN